MSSPSLHTVLATPAQRPKEIATSSTEQCQLQAVQVQAQIAGTDCAGGSPPVAACLR
jgi:hypothetical protein